MESGIEVEQTMRRGRAPRIGGLRDLCTALLPPEAGGPDPGRLAEGVERFVAGLPREARAAVRLGTLLAAAAASASGGRRLARLSIGNRERALGLACRRPAVNQALDSIRTLVLLVAGSDAEDQDVVGAAGWGPPVRPDPPLDVTPATSWPPRVRCDAIVVGSGAGGAAVARTLARSGLDTVVVEEGPRFAVDEFRAGRSIDRFARLYRDAGATVALGRPPILLPVGRAVGGTTVVNSGTCYRTPQSVLRRWRDRDGLTIADPDGFAPYLDEAWSTLGPAPVALEVMGRNGQLALEGATKLGWRSGPLMHNAVGCAGCCQSAIGCPYNAKSGVHLNALPEACSAGARIVSEARVERVLHRGGRARGVVARRADGTRFEILADRVVVAAGATETPPLLRRSDLGRHPFLGRNLSIHPALTVLARFKDPVVAWRGVLQSAGIEEFHESEGILLEATSVPAGMVWAAFPGFGRRLLADLHRADHYASLGALIADRPSGRVVGRNRAVIMYNLAQEDGRRLLRAVSLIGRVLFAAGAEEVVLGADRRAGSIEEMEDALAGTNPRRLRLAAFHPVGTARAGADPSRHPVAPDGRLRGIEGLWVADASILPTCPRVNPQVTIMALALAVADGIAGERG